MRDRKKMEPSFNMDLRRFRRVEPGDNRVRML